MALDGRAVIAGAGAALALAVPAALVGQIVDSTADGDGNRAVLGLAYLVVLTGLAVGGYVAGGRAPADPMMHGASAALLAFAIVQAVGVVRRLVGDDDISWVAIAFNAVMSACIGTVGGYVAARRAEHE